MGDLGVEAIASHFNEIIELEKLNLWGNKITDVGMVMLSENLNYVNDLKELQLGGNEITDKGLLVLGDNLTKCDALFDVRLSDNKEITNKALVKFYKIIEINKKRAKPKKKFLCCYC